jgi:hypothetical protein
MNTETQTVFVLWHRKSRRCVWRPVGSAPTQADAMGLMEGSGLKNGMWLVKPAGQSPNDDVNPVTGRSTCR